MTGIHRSASRTTAAAMIPDLTVTIVTSAAAVIGGAGGVLAWVQAVRVTRIRAEAERALEAMKLDAERRRRAFELASAEAEPLQAALAQAWSDVQTVKDAVARTLSPARHDSRSVLERVETAAHRLVEGYGRSGALLPPQAQSAWHNAKGLAGTVAALIEDEGELDERTRVERLREMRHALTDVQLALSTARASLRDPYVQRIMDLL